jgi:probable HAF family extracellular repeat protein
MKPITFTANLVLGALACTAHLAHAQYTAYDLGPGVAYGINNSGTVVGAGSGGAFSYNGGVMAYLGTPPASAAFGINNLGTIVGGTDGSILATGTAFSYLPGEPDYFGSGTAYGINDSGTVVGTTGRGLAFSYSAGVITYLIGGTCAYAINDSGTVVGDGFVYSGGVMTDLGLGAAYDINNSGIIVGAARGRGFIYSGGVMTDLGPGVARGINNSGTVVGAGSSGAFSYNGGVMTDLSPYLGSIGLTHLTQATAINDHGDIVGSGFTASEERHAFLLVVPEPSSGALLTLGVGALAWCTLRRRNVERDSCTE